MQKLISTLVLLLLAHLVSAQFTLVGPPDSTLLDFNAGAPEDTATITWTALSDTTPYNFHLDVPGGDFSMPAFTSDTLTDTVLMVTFAFVDSVLGDLGFGAGDTVDLIWTVTADTDTGTTFADTVYAISFVRFTSTSVRSSLAVAEFGLYPNPTQGQLRLKLAGLRSEAKVLHLRLTDLTGRVQWQAEQPVAQQIQRDISLPVVTPGLYLFTVEADGQQRTQLLRVE